MALGIGNNNARINLYMARRDKLNTEKNGQPEQNGGVTEGEMQDIEDLSPAARLQKFQQSVDEMSAGAAMFRNRKDFGKKIGSESESNFDRVLEDDVQPKVGKLIQYLKGGDGASIEILLQQARALFPDESDLVLVLREMLRGRNLVEVVRKRLKTLLSHVEKEAAPKRLKAGINIALKARLMGKTLQMSPALLRESYRDFLENNGDEVSVYQTWITTYGVEKRVIVTDFMEDALLSDIDAVDPSCSHTEFFVLQSRIGQIKIIRSSDILFVQGLMNTPAIQEIQHKEDLWLLFLFGILQNTDELGVLLTQVLGDYFLLAKRKTRAKLLQIIYWHSKKLPQNVFFSPEDRDELLASFERLLRKALHHENI
ncbi:type III secretion system gatekeeper subunit SctW [Yersinia kristensenii]|uniref:type III secretion system gatekeeper subunit SctW n=1 Tax=Yersinia kristensenii TaxID=28152 RepID=UPI0005E621DC|nr:type III secretion system gatekeeper subunit SctW [Yersinia kristensenii]CNF34693.1 type III secreted effector protein [Yersinia kristensenii]